MFLYYWPTSQIAYACRPRAPDDAQLEQNWAGFAFDIAGTRAPPRTAALR
jgi:hypothetical protein